MSDTKDPRAIAAAAEAERNKRIHQLRSEGLSYAQIAARLADEGYGSITRGRVAQIALRTARQRV